MYVVHAGIRDADVRGLLKFCSTNSRDDIRIDDTINAIKHRKTRQG